MLFGRMLHVRWRLTITTTEEVMKRAGDEGQDEEREIVTFERLHRRGEQDLQLQVEND